MSCGNVVAGCETEKGVKGGLYAGVVGMEGISVRGGRKEERAGLGESVRRGQSRDERVRRG